MVYLGVVEFDDEAGLFHGEVVNTRDVITFQGATVDELRTAMQDSVDDYLDWCAERGKEPEKPFSGALSCGWSLTFTAGPACLPESQAKA